MRALRNRLRLPVAVALGVALTSGAVALAYVRSITDKGTPVFWGGGCTWIAPDIDGSPDLTLDVVSATLEKSIANWQSATLDQGCSYLRISLDPPAAAEARLDRKNILKFRTDKWCRPAEPDKGQPEICYSPAAAAITTVFFTSNPGKADDGQILDADIQMNELNFTFVVEPTTQAPRRNTQIADLENTLTHELGHFQGLDHTCWDHVKPYETTPPHDNTGAEVPDCNKLDTLSFAQAKKIKEASMYNYASPGETIKRTPKADDIAGICDIYAVAKNPNSCLRPEQMVKSGCSIDGGDGGPTGQGARALWMLALLPLALVLRRRA